MKGLSLLVALATIGVDIGWDAGPSGQLLYTIRIEPMLLEPLRKGQPIDSAVELNDRELRRFQIVMGDPKASARPARQQDLAATEAGAEYGWQPNESGGLDYLVQITPERLEALAQGVPLVGEIHADVPEIHRFYIYVGVGQPPRIGLNAPRAPEKSPPQFLTVEDTTSPPNEPASTARPQFEKQPLGRTRLTGGQQQLDERAHGGYGEYASGDYSQDRGWRNEVGQNTRPPEYGYDDDRRAVAPATGADNRSRQYDDLGPRGQQPIGAYNQRPANPPYDQRLADRRAYEGQYAPAQPTTPYLQPNAAQPAPPQVAAPQTPPPAAPSVPPAVTAPAPQPTQQVAWRQPIPETAATEDDSVKPWTPLILTTLALFASLGANAYLGWLAWSFFWRYRDAADDLARFRTLSSGSRQAA